MSSELSILALAGLLTMVQILAHVLTAQSQVGLPYLISPRDEARHLTGIPGRCKRAAENAVVAFALFAPAVLLVQAQGGLTPATLRVAQVFLIARVVYAVVYPLGTRWVRTITWLVGFLATAWLHVGAI